MASEVIMCILMGLPGSGKSTFAEDVDVTPFRKVIFRFDDFPVVSTKSYKEWRKDVEKRLELLIRDELDSGPTVIIVDDIMTYKSMRYEMFYLARKLNLAGFCQVYLMTNLDTCIVRNSQRESTDVTDEMIRNQFLRIEPPGRSSAGMDRCFLIIEDNRVNSEEVLRLIEMSREYPLNCESDRTENCPSVQSAVHRIDLILRKHIGAQIQLETSSEAKKNLANDLNQRRQELLQDIRNKTVIFEEPFHEVINYL